jgi:hypothetical protein
MSFFEAAMLPDASKLALCQELLAEFGANVQRINDRSGEMIHGCLVSPGLHRDQDTNPTASLNYQKLTYNCLGCGSSGGLLWFIATCRGESSLEARRWLERVAGLGGQVMELDALLRFLDAVYARPAATPIPTYSEKLLGAWAYSHPYLLEDRGISEEMYQRFRLGWDPTTDRVVLPHFWRGKLVGWQTRKLPFEWRSMSVGDDSPLIHSGMANAPKYHSSPDFPKDSTIFNYQPGASTVVMEAALSAMTHEPVFHCEAVFGATVTDLQIRRLVKHDEVILWMDNDRAGWDAVLGHPEEKPTKEKPEGKERVPGMAELLSAYTGVRVVDSPWQQDPQALPTDAAAELKDAAVPWSIWRPPKQLYCFECKGRAHSGPCP